MSSRAGRGAGDDAAPVGVIAALRFEWATARPLAAAGWLLVHAGTGPERAHAAAASLLAAGCRRLLVWGTAGALVPSLRPGTVVLPNTVVAPDGRRYAADATWRDRVRASLPAWVPVCDAALATQPLALTTRVEKELCARRTGAVAVDQEAGAVAAVAAERGAAFAVLRAIVDPLELDVPPAVAQSLAGRWPEVEVALRLLARPCDAAGVLRLQRAARPARRALEHAARALGSATKRSGPSAAVRE